MLVERDFHSVLFRIVVLRGCVCVSLPRFALRWVETEPRLVQLVASADFTALPSRPCHMCLQSVLIFSSRIVKTRVGQDLV